MKGGKKERKEGRMEGRRDGGTEKLKEEEGKQCSSQAPAFANLVPRLWHCPEKL